MERFAANEIQVLVSTTVVEVGVNVPNATVYDDRKCGTFRPGAASPAPRPCGKRDAQSYCIMVNCELKESQKRLDILNQSNDGFKIASEDLKLRTRGFLRHPAVR